MATVNRNSTGFPCEQRWGDSKDS